MTLMSLTRMNLMMVKDLKMRMENLKRVCPLMKMMMMTMTRMMRVMMTRLRRRLNLERKGLMTLQQRHLCPQRRQKLVLLRRQMARRVVIPQLPTQQKMQEKLPQMPSHKPQNREAKSHANPVTDHLAQMLLFSLTLRPSIVASEMDFGFPYKQCHVRSDVMKILVEAVRRK
uniref:Uncharacterized protein MANES_11G156700 n=1 Tax=Rhizophora mucronata TaxID=61149 RepID=A0A2P2KNU9_RHIMU